MADIIQIQRDNNGELSKKQTEFNRLNAQIKELSDSISLIKDELPKFHERVSRELSPLTEKLIAIRKETIRMGEQMLSNHFTKKKEREPLIEILLELMDSLPEMDDEVIEMYNKVTNRNFKEDLEEKNRDEFLEMKTIFENMSGEKLDPQIDTTEKLIEYLENRAAQAYEEREELRRSAAEKRQKNQETRPKTARQMERERAVAEKKAQKQAAERLASKSVRELYMELVKTFHPDLEQDENEKVRKTAIMQRVVAAYENDDLLALLQLQLELECIAPNALNDLSEEKLNAFIRVLKSQRNALQHELKTIHANITRLFQQKVNLEDLEHYFERYIKSYKRERKQDIKYSEQLLAIFSNPNTLREWLKDG